MVNVSHRMRPFLGHGELRIRMAIRYARNKTCKVPIPNPARSLTLLKKILDDSLPFLEPCVNDDLHLQPTSSSTPAMSVHYYGKHHEITGF